MKARLKKLREEVYQVNMDLVNKGLVKLTWGNASAFDRDSGLMIIKPSGISYDRMKPSDMVMVDQKGNVVEGNWNPSSDTATHLVLYEQFGEINGVVHTHSEWATSWAQACRAIPCMGTTHADHFFGSVPCTRALTPEEIEGDYEKHTGYVIAETLVNKNTAEIPGVLVAEHGPFTWGSSPNEALKQALVLEEIAKMAFRTLLLGKDSPAQQAIIKKHFMRKHGPDAYYGQSKKTDK